MHNPLKVLFPAKSVAGIEINNRHIGVVVVSDASGSPQIEHISLKKVEDQTQLATELEVFFRTENLHPEVLVFSLPTSIASIRDLDLPIQHPKKLRQIIKYQMEPLVPYNIDDVIVDYLPAMKGSSITAIGVEKERLSEYLEMCEKAELHPDIVSIQDVALFSLFLKTNRSRAEQPIAILRLCEEETVVQIIRNRLLVFIRVLPGGKEALHRLRQTFEIYSIKNPRDTLTEIYLTGTEATTEGMVDRITEILDLRPSLWRPFDEFNNKHGDVEDILQSTLSVPLGLALTESNGSGVGLDLRREEFAVKTPSNLKRPIHILITMLLLLAVLGTFNVYLKLGIEEKRYAGIRKEITDVFRETFPNARQIVKGRELEQMRQDIDAEKAKYKWMDEVVTNAPVLEILLDLTKALSAHPDVRVDNISVDGKDVNLDGSASSFKAVDNLQARLSSVGAFSDVKLIGAKVDNRQKTVVFSLALERTQ